MALGTPSLIQPLRNVSGDYCTRANSLRWLPLWRAARPGALPPCRSSLHLHHRLEPPKIIRLPSNGMGEFPGFDGSMRGSSRIVFMAASRVALSGHSTQEKATVPSAVA